MQRAGVIMADLPAGNLKVAYNNHLVAEVLWKNRKTEKVERLYKRSLAVYRRAIRKEEMRSTRYLLIKEKAMIRISYGLFLQKQGKLDEAEKQFRIAGKSRRKIRDHKGDDGRVRLARLRIIRGALSVRKGDYARAEKLFGRAEQYLRSHFGNMHADLGILFCRKAELRIKQEKNIEARTLLRRAHKILRRTAGDRYPVLHEIEKNLKSI